MSELLKWLSTNPIAAIILFVALGIVVIAVIIIYLVAFFQGRDLAFWPPKIGAKPHKPTIPETPKKPETISLTNKLTLEDRQAFHVSLEERLAHAQNVYILGVNLIGIVTHYESFLKERAKAGCVFKILMVAPSFFAKHNFPGSWTAWHEEKGDLRQSISINGLEHIRQETQRLDIKFLPLPPPFSLLIIDPDKPHGEVQVEFYTYNANVSNRPHFILTKDISKQWYDFFVREFNLAWHEASLSEGQKS